MRRASRHTLGRLAGIVEQLPPERRAPLLAGLNRPVVKLGDGELRATMARRCLRACRGLPASVLDGHLPGAMLRSRAATNSCACSS